MAAEDPVLGLALGLLALGAIRAAAGADQAGLAQLAEGGGQHRAQDE